MFSVRAAKLSESIQALQDLVKCNPELEPVLQDHLEDYDAELIPTLFIAEVVDWLVEHMEDSPEVVASVVRWMNDTYPIATEELKDVIATGGVEAMPSPGQRGHELRGLLTAELQATDPWE